MSIWGRRVDRWFDRRLRGPEVSRDEVQRQRIGMVALIVGLVVVAGLMFILTQTL